MNWIIYFAGVLTIPALFGLGSFLFVAFDHNRPGFRCELCDNIGWKYEHAHEFRFMGWLSAARHKFITAKMPQHRIQWQAWFDSRNAEWQKTNFHAQKKYGTK